MDDLRKIDLKMGERRFKELSSASGGAMSLTPIPLPLPLSPHLQESAPLGHILCL